MISKKIEILRWNLLFLWNSLSRAELLPPLRNKHFLSFSINFGSRSAIHRWWALLFGFSTKPFAFTIPKKYAVCELYIEKFWNFFCSKIKLELLLKIKHADINKTVTLQSFVKQYISVRSLNSTSRYITHTRVIKVPPIVAWKVLAASSVVTATGATHMVRNCVESVNGFRFMRRFFM